MLTVHNNKYEMYEIGKFWYTYKFTVHYLAYSKLLLQVTSLQYIG